MMTTDFIRMAQIITEIQRIREQMKANVQVYKTQVQGGQITRAQAAAFLQGDADQFRRRVLRIQAALVQLPAVVSINTSDIADELQAMTDLSATTRAANIADNATLNAVGQNIVDSIADREPAMSIIALPLPT